MDTYSHPYTHKYTHTHIFHTTHISHTHTHTHIPTLLWHHELGIGKPSSPHPADELCPWLPVAAAVLALAIHDTGGTQVALPAWPQEEAHSAWLLYHGSWAVGFLGGAWGPVGGGLQH